MKEVFQCCKQFFLKNLGFHKSLGVGGKLLWSFVAMALLSSIMGLVAWSGFSALAAREEQLSNRTLPDLVIARKLSELSSDIIFTAQSLVNAKTETERLDKGRELSISGRILAELQADFSLSPLEQEELQALEQLNVNIIANLAILGREVGKRIELQKRLEVQQKKMFGAVFELTRLARSQVANSNAVTMANIARIYDLVPENNGKKLNEALDQLVEVDMDQLHRVSALELRIYQLLNLLVRKEKIISGKTLDQLLIRYNELVRNILYLAYSVEDPDRREKMQLQIKVLESAKTVFVDRSELIQVNQRIDRLNKGNVFLLSSLNQYVDSLVDKSELIAVTAGEQLKATLEASRLYVLVIVTITLLLMGLIVWRVVYKHIVRRLINHTSVLGRLARGDLTAKAEDSYEDELAAMAIALEVFRQSAIAKSHLEKQQTLYQEELTEHRDNLTRLVSAQTSKLQQANTELAEKAEMYQRAQKQSEKASQAKTRFLAHMSHEIRTPMNGVLGMLALLKYTALNTQQKDYVQAIGHSSEILLDILNDILDYSKIEAGVVELNCFNFSPGALLEELVQLMSGRAINKGLALTLSMDADVPDWLLGDAIKIRQVMLNLVGNAIKFTEQGEIVVVLKPGEEADFWMFSVSDTGTGIAEEKLQEIFEAFGQATHHLKQPGTGLGLSISQKLVEVMNGNLLVDSSLGKGSRFYFSIPLSVGQPVEIPQVAVTPLPQHRILLVEDNAVNRTVAEGYLKHLGQSVISAASCAEAKALIKKQHSEGFDKVDLVLMDINLPDGNGVDLTAELRRMTKASLPVIAVSAHVFKEDQQQFIEQGMNACLGKPLRLQELAEVIEQVMSGENHHSGLKNPVDKKCLINHEQLKEDIEILGAESVDNMAQLFFSSSQKLVDKLCNANGRAVSDIANIAHELKGAAGSMALPDLYELSAKIERLALMEQGTDKERYELKTLHEQSCLSLKKILKRH